MMVSLVCLYIPFLAVVVVLIIYLNWRMCFGLFGWMVMAPLRIALCTEHYLTTNCTLLRFIFGAPPKQRHQGFLKELTPKQERSEVLSLLFTYLISVSFD